MKTNSSFKKGKGQHSQTIFQRRNIEDSLKTVSKSSKDFGRLKQNL
jgi:hypothetical protein